MSKEVGWQCVDYDWDEVYDWHICFNFDYNDKTYWCCTDQHPTEVRIYEEPDRKQIVKTFYGKEDFYNGEFMGVPFKQVIDTSRIYNMG